MPYFAYVLERADGRCQAIKIHAETEDQARGRAAPKVHSSAVQKLHYVGSAESLVEGHGLYEKACAKAQKLESKRRAAAQPHECNAVTAKLF